MMFLRGTVNNGYLGFTMLNPDFSDYFNWNAVTSDVSSNPALSSDFQDKWDAALLKNWPNTKP